VEEVRKPQVNLIYEGKNITEDISSFLISFSYTDYAQGKADEVELLFEDRKHLWKGAWFPGKGTKIQAEIVYENKKLPCGTYEIDEIESSGIPDTVTIKGISAIITRSLRREKKNIAWNNICLSKILADIAKTHNLTAWFDAEDIKFDRVDQRNESDLEFLKRLCDENGLNLKVADEKLIMYEAEKYDARSSVLTIERELSLLTSFSFRSRAHDIYRACEVEYWDPEAKENKVYTFSPDSAPSTGHVLKINKRCKSLAEAQRKAKAELRKSNRNETTGEIEMVGNLNLLAGINVDISGFGNFSGKYFVEESRHLISREGYTVSANIRKVLPY